MLKNFLSSTLIMTLSLSMVACSQGTSNSEVSEVSGVGEVKEEASTKPVKIEALIAAGSTVLQDQDNFVSQQILEDIGVDITLTTFANANEAKTNLNLRLVGDDIPDIFLTTSADLPELVEQGYVLNLDDYLDQMPNAKNMIEEVKSLGQVNGIQYAMPKQSPLFIYGYWIRKDWLDKYSLPMPTTVDELMDTIDKVITQDPDGNGVNDTIGITGQTYQPLTPILASLGYGMPNDIIVNAEGKVVSPIYEDGYKDAILYLKDCIDRGLIDSEIMAVNKQLLIDKLTMGSPFVAYESWITFNKPDQYGPIGENNPDADWVQIGDLEGPNDTPASSGTFNPLAISQIFAVSSDLEGDTEKLNAVLKYLDYVSYGQPGYDLSSYGLEGQHYNIEDGEIVATDKMATEAEFTWLYQLMGRNEAEYLTVKFPYAKEDIDFSVDRNYVRTVNASITYPEWYQRTDAERYLQEEFIKFVFGLRPIEEYDDYIATLEKTYRYDEFVADAISQIENSGILN